MKTTGDSQAVEATKGEATVMTKLDHFAPSIFKGWKKE